MTPRPYAPYARTGTCTRPGCGAVYRVRSTGVIPRECPAQTAERRRAQQAAACRRWYDRDPEARAAAKRQARARQAVAA